MLCVAFCVKHLPSYWSPTEPSLKCVFPLPFTVILYSSSKWLVSKSHWHSHGGLLSVDEPLELSPSQSLCNTLYACGTETMRTNGEYEQQRCQGPSSPLWGPALKMIQLEASPRDRQEATDIMRRSAKLSHSVKLWWIPERRRKVFGCVCLESLIWLTNDT